MSQGTRSFFFGATLSEIGFILFFALLLFAFYQKEADSQIIEEDKTQITKLQRELVLKEKELESYEALAQLTPEDQKLFFQELVPRIELQLENENLEKENEGLQSQLEELADVKEKLQEMAEQNERPESEIREALELIEAVEEAVDNDKIEISPEKLADALKYAEAVEQFNQESGTTIDNEQTLFDQLVAASSISDYQRTNDDLKGQVKNLRGRIGGRDLPPCWANKDTGKIEYLFRIDIFEEGLLATKAAPEYREREFSELVNTTDLTNGLVDLRTFRQFALPILQVTDAKGCRHYVSITDKSENAYKAATLTIEDYFYKYVNRS